MAGVNGKLVKLILQGPALHRISALQQADREQAVHDLTVESEFYLPHHPQMDSVLYLSIQEGRLIFDVRESEDTPVQAVVLALGPFKAIIRDYKMLLESYADAVAQGREARIQAIDMGRRGLHNEGAELLMARLAGKLVIDFPTARRLFTLICALHEKL